MIVRIVVVSRILSAFGPMSSGTMDVFASDPGCGRESLSRTG